jgi:nicotinate-nucleotide adenylyltransferase
LFGGTFDPIHNGHLHAACAVCDALVLEEIHLVLSARPSHRSRQGASIDQRWDMLRLACQTDGRLVPDDREVHRAAPSYTVDTLTEIRMENPEEQIVWVIGSDAFALLQSWYRWEQIPRLANLVVLRRPDSELPPGGSMGRFLAAHEVNTLAHRRAGGVLILDQPMPRISAQEIRRTLAQGGRADHLLPGAVATYISQHGLYGVVSDPRSTE